VFWKWEFERYWLFYRLWGRLSYNPELPGRVWMDEMTARFGGAVADVMKAYESASLVMPEIIAVHLADPNMYIWPEINPGGLVDEYRYVLPSDWRYVASIREAADNRLARVASAKQTPVQTAARFDAMGNSIDQALERAGRNVKHGPEWLSTEPDLRVLALMAHYHAQKQIAAYHLELFDRTRDEESLRTARRAVERGLGIWQALVKLTDGLYPETMSFAPNDRGDWKDKLPYVKYDLQLVQDREEIYRQFGKFTAGFDFGAPVQSQTNRNQYRADDYVLQNNVAPGFLPVDASTRYSEERGYGWLADGTREAVGIPLTPYLEVEAVAKNPQNLPRDVLFRDYIRGSGAQKFAVKVKAGEYEVLFLHPDHSSSAVALSASDARLEISFPDGSWVVSGLIVKRKRGESANAIPPEPRQLSNPGLEHRPPAQAQVGSDLKLALYVKNKAQVKAVRLWYRAVDQLAEFKMIEHSSSEPFVVPAADVPANYDLMYYFEVLNDSESGWFQPDPLTVTPYYVVKTTGGVRAQQEDFAQNRIEVKPL